MIQRDDNFQFDVLLPSQLGRRRKQSPEERLMMAVLRDALDCLEDYRFATDAQGQRLFSEAEQWFLDYEAHWPYSFECICAALDLDSEAVRQRLRLDREGESDPRLPTAASPRLNRATAERENDAGGMVAEAEAVDVCHEGRQRRA